MYLVAVSPARGQRLKPATSAAAQARAVCDGLPGDIVALALPLDIAKIAQAGLINRDWQARPTRCWRAFFHPVRLLHRPRDCHLVLRQSPPYAAPQAWRLAAWAGAAR